jgi:hypothetical protein
MNLSTNLEGQMLIPGIVVLGVLLQTPSTEAGKLLTTDIRAASADKVLAKLSRETGLRMEAGPRVSNDILIISVRDQPLIDVCRQLAHVTAGTWRKLQSGWVLERSEAQESKERDAAFANRESLMAKALEDLKSSVSRAWTEAEIQRLVALKKRGDIYNLPESDGDQVAVAGAVPRALARCLKDIPIKEFAKLEDGGSFVFSTHPNPWQRALGKNADQAVSLLDKEQSLWSKVLKQKFSADQLHEDRSIDFDGSNWSLSDHQPWARTKPFLPKVERLVLGARIEWSQTLVLQLLGTDRSGSVAFEFEYQAYYPGRFGPEYREVEKPTLLPLSPQSRAYLALRDLDTSWPRTTKGREESLKTLRPWLVSPDQHDPLDLLASDAFLGYAKSKGLNLVGLLSDGHFAYGEEEGLTLERVAVDIRHDTDVKRSGKWLLVKPEFPSENRKHGADRKALAAAAKRLASLDSADLEWACQRWMTVQHAPYYHFSEQFFTLLTPAHQDWMQQGTPYMLGFYASLTREQRSMLAAGGSLSPADLTADQKVRLHKAIFGTKSNYTILYGPGGQRAPHSLEWPRKLEMSLTIRAPKETHRHVFAFVGEPNKEEAYLADIDLEEPTYSPANVRIELNPNNLKPALYEIRLQDHVVLQINHSPIATLVATFQEEIQPAKDKPKPLDQLPGEVSQKVQAVINKMKDWENLFRRAADRKP